MKKSKVKPTTPVEKGQPTEPVVEMPEKTVEQVAEQSPAPKRRLQVRVTDIIVFAVILAVIIGLLVFIIGRINLKNEVAQARTVSDKVVVALAKQDTAKIRSYGDKSFQAKNSAQSLNQNLTSTNEDGTTQTFADIYGKTKPVVSQQIVANNEKGQHVAIIYRYDLLKVPFYVRIDVTKAPGSDKWQVQALSASPDETKLLTK